jgi:hypothetical protein
MLPRSGFHFSAAYPISGGITPANAATVVETGEYRFSGVNTK